MGVFSKTTKAEPFKFDPDKLEAEILATMPKPVIARDRELMIEQPQVTAEDLGRITAEAIKVAHEAAANALDALGKEIGERVRRIEQLKSDSLKQVEDCKELAEKHRDAGKLMSAQVESAAADMAEARDMIEAMRKKIGG